MAGNATKTKEQSQNLEGLIRHKNSTTPISTLRKTYGDNFARGFGDDVKLDALLSSAGVDSLTEYLKKR